MPFYFSNHHFQIIPLIWKDDLGVSENNHFYPNSATELHSSIEKLLRTKLSPIYYLFSCF